MSGERGKRLKAERCDQKGTRTLAARMVLSQKTRKILSMSAPAISSLLLP